MVTTKNEVLSLNDTKFSTTSTREAEQGQNQPPSTTLSEFTDSNTPSASESASENDPEVSNNESELRTSSAIRK